MMRQKGSEASGDRPRRDPAGRHPLSERSGLAGRVITAFDPEGYVMVDGLLVRAELSVGDASPGDLVDLELDPAGRLFAYASGCRQGRR